MANIINENVRKYRKLKGLTQAQLAEKIGMVSSSYSQMERMGNIPAQRVLDIAYALEIDPKYLYGYVSNEDENPTVLAQPQIAKPAVSDIILTRKETERVKLIRTFSKEAREEVDNFIREIYDRERENKRKSK
ncbi:MAG: helix-turn-helix domain-containing protein [Ruminococcaceae bacterium]|nr:helix-turn-helix domain-containing protein [Oscillospiraceae bacterium]